jgi:hypothetical protein|tara:strand:- start:5454 stop:5741 length:288 start_codon:yes stop_codon:yes gene_type:complete
LAFGYLSLSVEEFWDLTPREFNNRLAGFFELQQFNQRMEWERCRWQTCYLLQPHTGKGKKIKPTDLIKFDWDKKDKKIKKLTAQELKQMMLKNRL